MKTFLISAFAYILSATLLFFSFVWGVHWIQNIAAFYFVGLELFATAIMLLAYIIVLLGPDDAAKKLALVFTKKDHWLKVLWSTCFNAGAILIFAAHAWFFIAGLMTICWTLRYCWLACIKSIASARRL